MTGWASVKLDARMTAAVAVNIGEDGTPSYKGERLVEAEPGWWMHPDAVALLRYLRDPEMPTARSGQEAS